MSKVVGRTVDKLVEIEKQSAQRLRKHESTEVPTVLIAMLFLNYLENDGADHDGYVVARRTASSRRRARANIGK